MRELDWKEFVNKLIYCWGCGRFGKPMSNGIPTGWKVLYNPHPEGKPGLHVCSSECQTQVLEALKKGPVLEPLEMGAAPLMPQEMKQAALDGSVHHRVRESVETVLDDEETVEAVTAAVADALLEQGRKAVQGIKEAVEGFNETVATHAFIKEAAPAITFEEQPPVEGLHYRAGRGGIEDDEATDPAIGPVIDIYSKEPTLEEAVDDPDVPWDEPGHYSYLKLVPNSDPEAGKRDAEFMKRVEEAHRTHGIPAEMICGGSPNESAARVSLRMAGVEVINSDTRHHPNITKAMKAEVEAFKKGQPDCPFPCKLVEYDSIDVGKDYDCEYEFAGEITCEECQVNGGRFDPRMPRDDQGDDDVER